MDALTPLASALGLGMLSGARLYATVLAVGLALRFHWFSLPAAWQHASALSDTRVLVLAGLACAIEFVADKIPWVDSASDSAHTFIRPIGAALLTSSLFSNVEPAYKLMLFLLAGGVALSGHSAKAAARLAVNHSPEPFSNVALSLVEDASVAGGLYLAMRYPWLMAAIALGVLALCAWLAPRIFRSLRAEWKAFGALLGSWFGQSREPKLTGEQKQWLSAHAANRIPSHIFDVIATRDVKGLRNAVGVLCLVGQDAVFFSKRWHSAVERKFGPLVAMEARKGLLLDEIALLAADGSRVRFDLLAGQIESARQCQAGVGR